MSQIKIIISSLDRSFPLSVFKNDTIEKWKKKYGEMRGVDPSGLKWKCRGDVLKNDKTFEYYDLEDDDLIISSVKNKGGGFGLNIVDLSKNFTKNLSFDPSAPSYKEVSYGLNIQSKCKNKSCRAFEDFIYIKIGYVSNWDLFHNLNIVQCPECNKKVKPLNFGFYNCTYKIEYDKDENDEIISGEVKGESGEKEFKVFDEYSSGKATFTRLIFHIERRN